MKLDDNHVQEVLALLKQRYPQGRLPCKMGVLCKENPDLEPQLRDIDNHAGVLWGKPLKGVLFDIGIFCDVASAAKPTISAPVEKNVSDSLAQPGRVALDGDAHGVLNAPQKKELQGRPPCEVDEPCKETPALEPQQRSIDSDAEASGDGSTKQVLWDNGAVCDSTSSASATPSDEPAPSSPEQAAEGSTDAAPTRAYERLMEQVGHDPIRAMYLAMQKDSVIDLTTKLDAAYPDMGITGFREMHPEWGVMADMCAKVMEMSCPAFLLACGYALDADDDQEGVAPVAVPEPPLHTPVAKESVSASPSVSHPQEPDRQRNSRAHSLAGQSDRALKALRNYFTGNAIQSVKIDAVQTRIQTLSSKLDEAYPSLDISGFRQAHKKWGEAASEIAKALQFANGDELLRAMGYTIATNLGGRPSNDVNAIFDELRRRYDGKPRCRSFHDLKNENPDLAGKLQTLSNNAGKLWGVTVTQKMIQEGILSDKLEQRKAEEEAAAEARQAAEEARKAAEEKRKADVRNLAEAALKELKEKYTNEPSRVGCKRLETLHPLLAWKQLYAYCRAQTTYASPDDLLIAEGIYKPLKGQAALDYVVETLQKRLEDKPFSGPLRTLISLHKDLPFDDAMESLSNDYSAVATYLQQKGILEDPSTKKKAPSHESWWDRQTREEIEENERQGRLHALIGDNTDFVVPADYKKLRKDSIGYCPNLRSITIPAGVTVIEAGIFAGCPNLVSITVEEGNPKYKSEGNCVYIPKDPNHYMSMSELIAGCSGSVIPEGVEVIASNAFVGCAGLKKITIPHSVYYIHSAFIDCPNIEQVEAKGGRLLRSEGNCLIYNNIKLVLGCASSVIPEGVQVINEHAFHGCTALENVVLPQSVTSIEREAFSGCTGLRSITIPPDVETIGVRAFAGCTALEEVDFQDGVDTIREEAFVDTPWMNKQGNLLIVNNRVHGYYGTGHTITIPEGVTSICHLFGFDRRWTGFDFVDRITSVILPDSLKSLGDSVFWGCQSLLELRLPAGLESIGYQTFKDCPAEITLPEKLRLNQKRDAYYSEYITGATLCGRDMADLLLYQNGADWDELRATVKCNPQDTLEALGTALRENAGHNPTVLEYLMTHQDILGSKAYPVFEACLKSKKAEYDPFALAIAKNFFENGDVQAKGILFDYLSGSNNIMETHLKVALYDFPAFPAKQITNGAELCALAIDKKDATRLSMMSELLFGKRSPSRITLVDSENQVPSDVLTWLLIELSRCRNVHADVKRVVKLVDSRKLTDFLWSFYNVVPNRPVQTNISPIIWTIGHIGTAEQVSKMLSNSREIRRRTEVSATGSGRGRNAYAIEKSIAYNDSPEVLLMLDKRGELAASAAVRGMSVDSLRAQLQAAADNMLDSQGTYRLNYGDRQFAAMLMPDMTLVFRNEATGKVSKSLPKPTKTDDAALAAAAAEEVKKLKTNIKNIAGQRTQAIQKMLYHGSAVSYADWKAQYLSSTILKSLAGGILWGVFDGKDTLLQPFCLNADGRLADASGNEILPQDQDRISVVDASQLSPEALETWRTLFWGKGTKAVVRQFEMPGRYVTKEFAKERYEGLTVSVGYAFNALGMGSVDSSQYASIGCNYIDVALYARWGDDDMEIDDISFTRDIPAFDQMTDHQKRLWNRDIIRLDSILHPEKQVESIVTAGDVEQIKSFVDMYLITPDNITNMLGLSIKHKHTEATAYLMQLKQDWLGAVQDPFAEFTLDF